MDHTITDGRILAVIKAQGAELRSLRDLFGTEYIWQAGPAWPRFAPVLFPIVGRLKDDQLRHAGTIYRLTQHGFARDLTFDWVARTSDACRLSLVDSDETRAIYPFAFRLDLTYALAAGALAMTFDVSNSGGEHLPASFGAHPAFNWPLHSGAPQEAYTLTFAEDEPAPVRRLNEGLLRPEPFPTPIEGRVLKLRATSLNNLAYSYFEQRQYTKAEPLFQRALAIQEKALGLNHPDVTTSLENMAALYRRTSRENTAERLEDRAAKIRAMRR